MRPDNNGHIFSDETRRAEGREFQTTALDSAKSMALSTHRK